MDVRDAVVMLQGFYESTGTTKIARHVDVMRAIRLIDDVGKKYRVARTIHCAQVLGAFVEEAGDVGALETYGFRF